MMTSTKPIAILVADSVGLHPVLRAEDLRDLISPLNLFWLDVFAVGAAAQAGLLTHVHHRLLRYELRLVECGHRQRCRLRSAREALRKSVWGDGTT